MKPYYEQDGITIYHGDCREVVDDLTYDIGCVVTDPPYGISIVQNGSVGGRNAAAVTRYLPVFEDDRPFDPAFLLSLHVPTILFGANHFSDRLPPSAAWLVWDKRKGDTSVNFADCELAWTNLPGPARLYHHRWNGMIRDGERITRVHPTQKPVEVMRWCVEMTTGTVLDPFMGSGTTLRAAKDLGRHAVGIEIEERYCEIAANRLAQGSLFSNV